jgi:hypothetical protein
VCRVGIFQGKFVYTCVRMVRFGMLGTIYLVTTFRRYMTQGIKREFTPSEIKTIQTLAASQTLRQIAKRFDVSHSTIDRVLRRASQLESGDRVRLRRDFRLTRDVVKRHTEGRICDVVGGVCCVAFDNYYVAIDVPTRYLEKL